MQRVIVDGWTTGEAARVTGLDERTVARWVAAYRRRGMASLREDPGDPHLRQRLVHLFHAVRRGVARRRGAPAVALPEAPSPLRRSRDDRQ